MKTASNRKASFLFLLAAGALAPYAVAQDLSGIETQIQGEWIAYRGDQFDIKKITRDKTTQNFYDWNGNLLYQRTSDLKVKVVGSGERKTIIEKGAEWHYLAGGQMGEPYRKETSIPQGCPLSMALVALLLRPWVMAVRSHFGSRSHSSQDMIGH